MVSFIVIVHREVTGDVCCVLQNLQQRLQNKDVRFTIVPYRNKECEGSEDKDFCWVSLDETAKQIQAIDQTSTDNASGDKKRCDLRRVADKIHRLADSLPVAGAVTDVYVWPPDVTENSEYILFLGALRRLKDWHNARVTLFDSNPSPDTEFMQKFLSADVHFQPENFQLPGPDRLLWRGKVSICDKIENKGLMIPGVSLYGMCDSSEPLCYPVIGHTSGDFQGKCLLGRMFEVLDEISLKSVPAIMKTPHVYKLCLYQKHSFSQVLMDYIQQNSQTGMLARLAVYPDHEEPCCCGDAGLSTEAWKENIMADIQYTQEPEEDLQDNYEFLYFIITSPDQHEAVEHFVAYAHLLQHPYNLNSAIVSTISQQAMCKTRKDNPEVDLSDLPLLNWSTLRQIEQDIVVLQRAMLRKLIVERKSRGEPAEMEPGDLLSYLAEVRLKYITTLASKLPAANLMQSEPSIYLKKEVYEVTENSYEWPERLVQQYMESQKRSLSRIQSSESMLMSSPVPQSEGASSALDLESFLQYFQADGSAAASHMSPVRRRHASRAQSRLSLPDASTSQLTQWPDSKDFQSHDVYYNVDKKCEKVNSHFNRLQEKFVKNETFSSCLSPQVTFPRAKKKQANLSGNELRRSPRKKAPRPVFDENAPPTSQKSLKPSRQGRLFESTSGSCEKDPSRRFSTPTALPQKPRRQDSSLLTKDAQRRNSDVGLRPAQRQVEKLRRESVGDSSFTTLEGQGVKKESRSERHKRRLQDIVDSVLAAHGVDSTDPIYKSCSTRLFKVTKLFVMDLPNSRNLKDEMRKIAESQVKQVIEVDRMRLQATSQ